MGEVVKIAKAPENEPFALQPSPWTAAPKDHWSDYIWVHDAKNEKVVLVATTEDIRTQEGDVTTIRKVPLPHAEHTAKAISALPELIRALKRFVDDIDNYVSNNDGHYPEDSDMPDAGCIECTLGTVPNDRNTGLCAYHQAREALFKAGAL